MKKRHTACLVPSVLFTHMSSTTASSLAAEGGAMKRHRKNAGQLKTLLMRSRSRCIPCEERRAAVSHQSSHMHYCAARMTSVSAIWQSSRCVSCSARTTFQSSQSSHMHLIP
eukprot:1159381-Pelagomonas_calceolata.AAC.14